MYRNLFSDWHFDSHWDFKVLQYLPQTFQELYQFRCPPHPGQFQKIQKTALISIFLNLKFLFGQFYQKKQKYSDSNSWLSQSPFSPPSLPRSINFSKKHSAFSSEGFLAHILLLSESSISILCSGPKAKYDPDNNSVGDLFISCPADSSICDLVTHCLTERPF